MKKIFAILAFVLAGAAARAQNCPTVAVSSETGTGAIAAFTADLTGGDQNVSPTYNWAVSNGTISSGQGTPSITVRTENLESGSSITATVDIGGYDRSCNATSSSTITVAGMVKAKTKTGAKGTKTKLKTK